MSPRGFLLEAPFSFLVGRDYVFQFTAVDQRWAVTLRGAAVFSNQRIENTSTHVSGFLFTDIDVPQIARRIWELLELASQGLRST